MAKGDLFTYIQPVPYNIPQIRHDIKEALAAAGEVAKVDFKLSYWNWEQDNQPKWKEVGPRSERGDLVWKYTTKSTPYIWVDIGTKGPYPITAKNFPRLKFQTGFIAKTTPGRLTSGIGATFGDWASPVEVEHPGIKPRRFSVQVKEKADEYLPKLVQSAVKKGVLRSSRQGIRAE